MASAPTTDPNSRAIWLALILLTAVIVGAAAGWLAHAGGANPPAAVLTGGGAFAGATLLCLALAQHLRDDRPT
jgi:hypothetical protein